MEKIVLLADSFLSPLLLQTLRDLKVSVWAAMTLPAGLTTIDSDELRRRLEAGPTLVYSNAEDVLPLVTETAADRNLIGVIARFKDKVALRKLLRGITPPLYFTELDAAQLRTFRMPEGKRLVVKPAVGFLSLGVAQVADQQQWREVLRRIDSELATAEGMFAPPVLKADRFIVEEFVTGQEYACDGYFNGVGQPVVLQIVRHLFRDQADTRDLVYYTDSGMLAELTPKVMELLRQIGARARIRYFPFHLEFRLQQDLLQVIEINPLRFGGFGLADLTWYAFGVNPYACYLNQTQPDWQRLLPRRQGRTYAFVLGRVPATAGGKSPDHAAFRATFDRLLDYAPIDHRRFPCFCRVLAEAESAEAFTAYLNLDFDRFFH